MIKHLTFLSIFLIFGCASTSEPEANNSNTFNLNGQNITLSEEVLTELRNKWELSKTPIVVSTQLTQADIQWSMDYISVMELVNSQGCESLEILESRNFENAIDTDNTGANMIPGKFDHVWEVQVCAKQRKYRIINEKGDSSFTVYPLNL